MSRIIDFIFHTNVVWVLVEVLICQMLWLLMLGMFAGCYSFMADFEAHGFSSQDKLFSYMVQEKQFTSWRTWAIYFIPPVFITFFLVRRKQGPLSVWF